MAAEVERDVLPTNIKPINYDISLYDLEFAGDFIYQGTVSILSKVTKPSKEIVLNSHQLKIHMVEVVLESATTREAFKATGISYDAPRQRATISFAEDIPITEKATVTVQFQGIINTDMAGFSRAKYRPSVPPAASVAMEGDRHLMFSTQFESCDARRAFPCFDEPNLKATFDFEIEIPEDQVALSNMPEKEVKKVENKSGFKVVSFEKTPIMSTYLLAWAIGDFEYVEDFTKREYNGKPIPVRVYTTRGLKHQAQYALDHAPVIIDYFSEIFGIDYPLPKADLLAVHEFSSGAMENWGLVTYRTTAVLFDEKTSDAKYKNRVAYVVAHELAHQWFGNLVTMDWWDELWLNEGFATWIGWLATDKLHPDWNVWPQFVSEGMQTAFALDALRSSHPIEVPVKDALDVDQIFDRISYDKGSSVIRMLATHLGQDTFLKGVSKYLKDHSYGNATTTDLWTALSEASSLDINTLMDPWIRKIGFPVLTVTEEFAGELGQLALKQSRYLSSGDVKVEDDTTTWWLPLGFSASDATQQATPMSLTKKEDIIRNVDDLYYKLNTDNAGFYRTNYPPARLSKLGLHAHHLTLSDKIGLVGDAGALAFSGNAATPGLLALVEGLSQETDYLVWSQILGSLALVKSIFSEEQAIVDGLKSFILKLIDSAVAMVGWEPRPNENLRTSQLRSLLIATAGMNGHQAVITEAEARFQRYFGSGDTEAIPPNLRSAILGITIRNAGEQSESEYRAVLEEWRTTTSVDGKEIALRALGRTRDPKLLAEYLEFISSEVSIQDIHTGVMALSANPKARYLLWNFFRDKFDYLHERLAGNMVVFDRFVRLSLYKFSDPETEKEIADFFEDKNTRGYDRSLSQARENILCRAAYKKRDAVVILEWLKANHYV